MLFFGGDTSHGDSYQAELATRHAAGRTSSFGDGGLLQRRGYDDSFRYLLPLMEGCDRVILNLETTLTALRDPPHPSKPSHLWSDPQEAPRSLVRLGVDAVSLSNNHAMDFGSAGLADTSAALRRVGIGTFGAGRNLSEAERPLRVHSSDREPIEVAVIGMFERRDWYQPFEVYAGPERPGVNPIDLQRLTDQIAQLKRERPGLFVILSVHWGENHVWRNNRLRKLAEGMVAAGADLIVGHGAHRLQEVELIDGKWVFFSIGNFVFNSTTRYTKRRSPPYSLPIRVSLSRDERGVLQVGVKGYPIRCDNRVIDYRPRTATEDEVDRIRQLLLEHDATNTLAEHAVWGTDRRGHYVAFGKHEPNAD